MQKGFSLWNIQNLDYPFGIFQCCYFGYFCLKAKEQHHQKLVNSCSHSFSIENGKDPGSLQCSLSISTWCITSYRQLLLLYLSSITLGKYSGGAVSFEFCGFSSFWRQIHTTWILAFCFSRNVSLCSHCCFNHFTQWYPRRSIFGHGYSYFS